MCIDARRTEFYIMRRFNFAAKWRRIGDFYFYILTLKNTGKKNPTLTSEYIFGNLNISRAAGTRISSISYFCVGIKTSKYII